MKRNQNQNTSVKDRLTEFFVLLTGLSLFICLFAILFSMMYGQRYKMVIQKLVTANTCYENLDLVLDNISLYIRYEDISYYDTAQDYMDTLQVSLQELKSSENSLSLRREMQDIIEMINYLDDQLYQLTVEMEADTGIGALNSSSQEYEEITKVYESVTSEFKKLDALMLNQIESVYAQMEKESAYFFGASIFLLLLICLIMFIQIREISRSLSQPIYGLTQAAEKIGRGELEDVDPLVIPSQTLSELRMLISVFNDMMLQLKQQIKTLEENARIRQQLLESKFKELQMQINPHFLFNTLNMIADNAYMENAVKTEELLVSAAQMFRYSLDFSGKPIPLSREIEELKNYVFIQKQRYGQRIQFVFDLDNHIHQLSVPSMILQPLVENAIIHGVGNRKGPSQIRIQSFYNKKEHLVCLLVEDNGEGMSPEKLTLVQDKMKHYSGDEIKIGLGNVYLRLKLFFQNQTQMRIESQLGKGTKVTIEIPYTEEAKYV